MDFKIPDASEFNNESDVESKLIMPLLTAIEPFGLSIGISSIQLVEYLSKVRANNVSITASYLDSSDYAALTDLTEANEAIMKLRPKCGPWIDAFFSIPIDSYCNGVIIKRIDDFGLLIEIKKDITGRLHKSKLPDDYLYNNLFQVGKSINVKIISFDPIHKKLDLEYSKSSFL